MLDKETWASKLVGLSLSKTVGNYMPELEVGEFIDWFFNAENIYTTTFSGGTGSKEGVFHYINENFWNGSAVSTWDSVTIDVTDKGYFNSNGITYPSG